MFASLKQRHHASSVCSEEWREMKLAENFEWAASRSWQQEGLRVVVEFWRCCMDANERVCCLKYALLSVFLCVKKNLV